VGEEMAKIKWQRWVLYFLLGTALIIVYKMVDKIDYVIAGIYKVLGLLKPFFIGFALAYILNGPAKKLEGLLKKSRVKFIRNKSRGISVFVIYLALFIIVSTVLRFFVPAISKSFSDFINNLNAYINAAKGYLDNLKERFDFLGDFDYEKVFNSVSPKSIINYINLNDLNRYAQGVFVFTSGVFSLFLAIIISIYMLLDKEYLIEILKKLLGIFLSEGKMLKTTSYLSRIDVIFTKFIYAQLTDALIIGVLSTIALAICRVKYAVLLGFLIGLMNLIPYFGAIIACAIAVLVSFLTGGVYQAIYVLVTLIVLQQIDANIIGPKLIGDTLDIKPILVILAITLGGGLFGLLGMFLSVPVMAILKALVTEYAQNKKTKIV